MKSLSISSFGFTISRFRTVKKKTSKPCFLNSLLQFKVKLRFPNHKKIVKKKTKKGQTLFFVTEITNTFDFSSQNSKKYW